MLYINRRCGDADSEGFKERLLRAGDHYNGGNGGHIRMGGEKQAWYSTGKVKVTWPIVKVSKSVFSEPEIIIMEGMEVTFELEEKSKPDIVQLMVSSKIKVTWPESKVSKNKFSEPRLSRKW